MVCMPIIPRALDTLTFHSDLADSIVTSIDGKSLPKGEITLVILLFSSRDLPILAKVIDDVNAKLYELHQH